MTAIANIFHIILQEQILICYALGGNIMTLDKLEINNCAKIHSLNCNGDLRRRLLDLGLVNGTIITAVLKSPMGNPIAYEVRGSTIALRKEDSKLIIIN